VKVRLHPALVALLAAVDAVLIVALCFAIGDRDCGQGSVPFFALLGVAIVVWYTGGFIVIMPALFAGLFATERGPLRSRRLWMILTASLAAAMTLAYVSAPAVGTAAAAARCRIDL
jgi:hypothetical protein